MTKPTAPTAPTTEEILDFLSRTMNLRLFLKDEQGRIVWGNASMLAAVPDAGSGKTTVELFDFDPDAATVYLDSDRVAREQGRDQRLEPFRPAGRDEIVLTWKQRLDRDGSIFIMGGFIDMTEIVQEKNQTLAAMAYRAAHDDLTGLLNRGTFYALLENSCAQRNPAFAVLYIDLNGFKQVNDSLGHIAGDELLKKVAAAISDAVREGDATGRMGGDEFCILLPGASSVEAAVVCDRVSSAIARLGASSACGIAVFSSGESPDDVIARADRAMYVAKRGHEPCRVDQVGACAVPVDLIQALDAAIERGGLVPFFQPIVQSHNRRVLGYEALCRWPHAGKILGPGDFLPIAEEAGWLPRIDWLMLEQACRELEYFEGQWISVNLSGDTLLQPGFKERLAELMRGYFVSQEQISLEISESIAIGQSPNGISLVLKELGHLAGEIHQVKLFVDDYGSAFAQLQALMALCQKVPSVKALKLDASLVSGLHKDTVKSTICRSTIDMAHGLGLDTIAEGVETEEEALALRGLGCDLLQGFLLGRPLPIEEYIPS